MFQRLLIGLLIGTASVTPGVSGGTIAVAMGIYDKLIYAFTHIFSEFQKSISYLFPVAIGMVTGTIGLSFIIEAMFRGIPFQTNLLFIGLILGGLSSIGKRFEGKKIRPHYVVMIVVTVILIIGVSTLGGGQGEYMEFDSTFGSMGILFLIGVVAAATMVIPGVSGSMLLIMMGCYSPLLQSINTLTFSIARGEFRTIPQTLYVLVPFGLGVVIGAFLISKGVEWLFGHYLYEAYSVIIGLIVATPFVMISANHCSPDGIFTLLTGIVALVVGIWGTTLLGE